MNDYRAEMVVVQPDRTGRPSRLQLLLADIVVAAVLPPTLWGMDPERFRSLGLAEPLLALALFVSGWVAILWVNGAYRRRDAMSVQSEALVVLRATVWSVTTTFTFLYLTRLPDVSRMYVVMLFGLLLAASLAVRIALRGLPGSLRGGTTV